MQEGHSAVGCIDEDLLFFLPVYRSLEPGRFGGTLNTRIADACTGLSDVLPAPVMATTRDEAFEGTIRLGSFDFLAGPACTGSWCASARRLLGWKSAANSIQQFFQLVESGDREALEAEWNALLPGRPIDRVIGARIGTQLRHFRFVAGCSEDGSATHIAGFVQDVSPSRISGAEGYRETRTSSLLNTFILMCK